MELLGLDSFQNKRFTTIQIKVGLENTDTKRIWHGINSKAYGHHKS